MKPYAHRPFPDRSIGTLRRIIAVFGAPYGSEIDVEHSWPYHEIRSIERLTGCAMKMGIDDVVVYGWHRGQYEGIQEGEMVLAMSEKNQVLRPQRPGRAHSTWIITGALSR
ncbi:hypothetical protein HRR83_007608 [Exophiala dermatitidis]|uniref:Uncharacterized protein n=1 Tax=Exophiala dermatitidis TaxID=5970 RepID=A0AAN6ERW8_EXODE|nr:hypothetical protein HRR74_007153 [Exophiala dermatitidis]KAJ4521746.1 hypothetical protein HRR73_002944 [Exophiala dermatitidis]KAJ4539437.1 hypothetical protein HRR77_006324 [Exophiala dermatitidis]KAJ4548482.1 hypothetical protein HRR76_001078 [Exophiala dermatitidis]KAJ4562858.1 hypothetical protein HRR79_006457 [Exophiala dermatitidis]